MKKTNMNNTTMNASGKRNIKVRIIAIALSTAAAFSAIGIFAGCSAGTAKVQAKAVAVGTNENNGITGGSSRSRALSTPLSRISEHR